MKNKLSFASNRIEWRKNVARNDPYLDVFITRSHPILFSFIFNLKHCKHVILWLAQNLKVPIFINDLEYDKNWLEKRGVTIKNKNWPVHDSCNMSISWETIGQSELKSDLALTLSNFWRKVLELRAVKTSFRKSYTYRR